VMTSPCFHFLDVTCRAYVELLGVHIRLCLRRPGFYPRGGGVVEAHIQPCPKLRGLELEDCGAVSRARVMSAVAGLPETIAQRQARRAEVRLQAYRLHMEYQLETWSGGPGTVLGVELDTQPAPTLFFGLGARGKPAEQVADEAVDQVIAYLGEGPTAVDPHSADQLILPLT